MRVRKPMMAITALVLSTALGLQIGVPEVSADVGPENEATRDVASAVAIAAQDALEALTGGPVTVTRDAGGLAHLLGTSAGAPIPLPAGMSPTADAEAQARAHLERAGVLFGLLDQATELRLVPLADGLANSIDTDRVLRFEQLRSGVPVLAGELVVVLDALGALKSVTGELLPAGAGLAPAPQIDADAAREIARAAVARPYEADHQRAIRASAPELWHLDPALIGVPVHHKMSAGPVWRTEVSDRGAVRELVLIDARTGGIPLQLDLIHTALDRVVCDNNNAADPNEFGQDCSPSRYARIESAGTPTSIATDVDAAFAYAGDTQRLYDSLGVNLTDMLGLKLNDNAKKLRSTVQFCPPNVVCSTSGGTLFNNAFWNGRGIYYGAGWAQADDIVAHELAHGVTEKTARLLYLYQSGAISESMSDVFGELVDLGNSRDGSAAQEDWLIGEDVPRLKSPFLRSMRDPNRTFPADPDRMRSANYNADLFFADNGGVHANSGVGNKAAFLIADGGGFNGQSVGAIGRPKTAVVFFRALTMLTSGADYADLGGALTQACANLVGSAGITGGDCENVRRAVVATEMAAQPITGAAAPEAEACPAGTRAAAVVSDGFENFSAGKWTLGTQWQLIDDYARSGTFSLYGVEPEAGNAGSVSSSASMRDAFTVPRGVQVFVRFDHQYRLDATSVQVDGIERYYDGAVLEYQIGNGPWTNASTRTWQNGPDKTIRPEPGATYPAFGGDSNGYNSSRLNATFLEGEQVRLRWTVTGDRIVAPDGWTIDNVQVLACGTTAPSDVRDAVAKAKKKKVKLTWNPPVYQPAGGIETYKVVRKGGGQKKAKFNVKGSKESLNVKKLRKGKTYTFTIQPIGEDGKGPKTKLTAKAK